MTHSGTSPFSALGLSILAVFALLALLGAGLLLSLAFGSGTDFLRAVLLFSPALLPCCAIVALVNGHGLLSKVLVGAGVLAAIGLGLGSAFVNFFVCYTDASTLPPGCGTTGPRAEGSTVAFAFAALAHIRPLSLVSSLAEMLPYDSRVEALL
jgi:hypothetical protein